MRKSGFDSGEILGREQLKAVFGGYALGEGDCFGDAIIELEALEASIGNGVKFSDAEAVEWLNINYATCVCQERYQPIASIELYDTCWGF